MPEGISVADVASLPTARLLFGDLRFPLCGVTTDTREEGLRSKLYVALKGDRWDGHKFLEAASDKSVGCVLIESRGVARVRDLRESGRLAAAVVVSDTLKALGDLAGCHRARLGTKIVAITGSNGKTSAKDFTAAILSTTYRTLSAPRSFNNAIGVPLTILQMTKDTQLGVLEMGMNHPGELEELCRIANPDVVAITSIAPAHIGVFSSLRRVAQAKAEILTASRPGITAFLPSDTPFLPLLCRRAKNKKIWTFGMNASASWRISHVQETLKRISFQVAAAGAQGTSFHCPNFGEHQLTNVLLAVGIAAQFAVPLKKIKTAVSKLSLPPGRGETFRSGRHILINDTYNANPGSMEASLKRVHALQRMLKCRRSSYHVVLVLGDMLELGGRAAAAHRQIGRIAMTLRPRHIIFVGQQGPHLVRGFVSAGGKANVVTMLDTPTAAVPHLQTLMQSYPRLLILLKASNQIGLNKIIAVKSSLEKSNV